MSIVVPAVLPSSHDDLIGKLSSFVDIPAVDRIQIDVIDGKLAGPACWPYTAPEEMSAMITASEMLPHLERVAYEIDLMCIDAERAVEDWLALGATRLTFHAETVAELQRLLAFVKGRYGPGANFATGLIAFGVAFDIDSDFTSIESVLGEIEYVQFMGIAQIGQQGQPFDDRVFDKIRTFHAQHPTAVMQVDGGISLENARKLLSLGVTNLVIGSALGRSSDPAAALAAFENLKNAYGV